MSKQEISIQEKLKDRIFAEMRTHGDSQKALSIKAGIHESKLSKIKNGAPVSVETLCKIADVYGISVDDMLGRKSRHNQISLRDIGKMIISIDKRIGMQFTHGSKTATISYDDMEAIGFGATPGDYYECHMTIPLWSGYDPTEGFPDYSRLDLNRFIANYARIKAAFPDENDEIRELSESSLLSALSDFVPEEPQKEPDGFPPL